MTKEDILHHFQDINFYYGDCMMYADLSGMLDELIAENKGEWVFDETLDKHYYCSECKSMGVSYWDYCPYCGARMKGGE